MIGFGELRRHAAEWHLDISQVERIYALDWLLIGIFEVPKPSEALVLAGASALGKAYFPDYPQDEEADFILKPRNPVPALEGDLQRAASRAGAKSGLSFKLHSFSSTRSRFEYTGPLGRRSAAQPLLTLRFHLSELRLPPVERAFIHPFSDRIDAVASVVSLEEMAAERIANFKRPRARDVYDLWFILSHADSALNRAVVRELVLEIAAKRGTRPSAGFDPMYRSVLSRAWESSLGKVNNKPDFESAEHSITVEIKQILQSE